MSIPSHLKYTKDHEWAKIEQNTATIGITDHAQGALGDIVFLELPAPGKSVAAGESFGVVESVKAVSELYAPVSGKIIETNTSLVDHPAQINSDPYDSGWLVRIELSDTNELEQLMDAKKYETYVKNLT